MHAPRDAQRQPTLACANWPWCSCRVHARGYKTKEATMFTKSILFALLAACGVQSHSAASPDERLGGDPYWDDESQAAADAASRDWLDRRMKTAPDESDKLPPEEPEVKDQHFCCQSVDLKNWTGDGCVTIAPTQIDLCTNVLYCPGKWGKQDGKVTCE
jgi:hypothetical protein